jgi:hypothetical protein
MSASLRNSKDFRQFPISNPAQECLLEELLPLRTQKEKEREGCS